MFFLFFKRFGLAFRFFVGFVFVIVVFVLVVSSFRLGVGRFGLGRVSISVRVGKVFRSVLCFFESYSFGVLWGGRSGAEEIKWRRLYLFF